MIVENKILLYSSGNVLSGKLTGGVKRFIELSKYICQNYNAVLCSQTSPEDAYRLLGIKNVIQLSEIKKGFPYNQLFPELSFFISNYKRIKSISKDSYSDIIVFDVPPAIGLAIMNFRNIVLMIRKDMIGYEMTSTKSRSLKFYLKLLVQWICESICLLRCKKIITQCKYDCDVLIKRHKLLKRNILSKSRILINNVNPSWSRTELRPDRSKYNDKFRICFIGDFDNDRKGHDLLLPVAKRLCSQDKNLEFIMIGGGLRQEYYRELYQSKNITFTGRLQNPLEMLAMCDLMVVPSFADSCPNTVLEALNNDVLVIGSKAGGIPEILENENALFELDEQSLEKLILRIIYDESYRENLKKLESVRKKELEFDWAKKMTELILNF